MSQNFIHNNKQKTISNEFDFIDIGESVAVRQISSGKHLILSCGNDLKDYCAYLESKNQHILAHQKKLSAFTGGKPISELIHGAQNLITT